MASENGKGSGLAFIGLVLLIVVGVVLAFLTLPTTSDDRAAAAGDDKIIAVVRDYLVKNPEILEEMTTVLRQRQEAARRQKQSEMLVAKKEAVFASEADYVHNPAGKIPVVEFFDYQCGYCKRVHDDVVKLRAEHSDVRFIYKEFPVLGPNSELAARAAVASKKQGKYAEFHDALMTHPGGLNKKVIDVLAAKVGLDVAQLHRDMKLPDVQAEIDNNVALGRSLGVTGTPTLIFGDEIIPGAIRYQQMTALVDRARKSCKVC